MTSIFIFRRDFRVEDNIGFIECCKKSKKVIPIFIFTPEQITDNKYFSDNSFQFLLESLHSLNEVIKLNYYYGHNIDILTHILKEHDFDSIFFNMDYTLYAKSRDKEIRKFCEDNNKECFVCEDYLLKPIGAYLKADGTPYQKYTPFKDNAKLQKVPTPIKYTNSKKDFVFFHDNKFKLSSLDKYYKKNPDILLHGGRHLALEILKDVKKFVNYPDERDDLITPTTHLSSYIKYGCVSIREVYHTFLKEFGPDHTLINQLYWREFYYYLGYYIPRVLEGKSLKEKYNKIIWENNPTILEAWKNGLTGFPAVDASMRELNKTGYMHNRGRLITSGVLIKILDCDWRLGELYFAQKLIDYDPIVNNGNWQWSAGSGADSQPYFRILSPWKQAIDNDPNALYIKKWIPELKDVPNKDIFKWSEKYSEYSHIKYPKPIVDYKKKREEYLKMVKKAINP